MSKISQQLGLNLKELPPSISDKKGHLIIYEHPTLSNFMELSFYDNLSKGQLFNICYNTSNSVKHKNDINPIFCDFEKIRFEIKQVFQFNFNMQLV